MSQPNDYQTSFRAFLRDCVYTTDTAMGGQIRSWPFDDRCEPDPQLRSWDEYWSVWEEALLTRKRLFADKVRRVMASNVACAWDLWVASGGIDPRWPALTTGGRKRLVLIQGRKMEGQNGSQEFLARIGEMYKVALAHGLRDRWPGFPEWEFGVVKATSSTGAIIEAQPQGDIRGPGPTLIHMEELSVWEQAEASVGSAIPALNPDGHLLVVTTPRVGTYAADIREGRAGQRIREQAVNPLGYEREERAIERGVVQA